MFIHTTTGRKNDWITMGSEYGIDSIFFVWLRVCLLYVVDNVVNQVVDYVVDQNFKVKLLW